MRRARKYRAIIFFFWLFVLFLAGYAPSARAYTIGVVPQFDQRQLFATWQPILEELQKRTGLSFTLVPASTIPAFEKEYLQETYDFVYLNPYHLLKANKAAGYLPIVRDGSDLRGILVVREDSPVKNPAELNGKTVAFPSPNALGASLLMRADLSNLFHLRINPLYATSHDSVYLHVAKGLAAAGGGVEKTLKRQEETIRAALRVIYVTRPMPSHPVAYHPRVPGSDAEKVQRAFMEMAAAPEGRELLGKIPMNNPISTVFRDYAPMLEWGLEAFWVEKE